MKIAIASDTHNEISRRWNSYQIDDCGHPNFGPNWREIKKQNPDLVLLPGDIDTEGKASEYARLVAGYLNCPVFFVAGNHEFYHQYIDDLREYYRSESGIGNAWYLDNSTVDLGPVRIIGTTLWTDYRIFGDDQQTFCMSHADQCLNDHRVIARNDHRFSIEDALQEHETAMAYIKGELEKPFEGKTIVMTHHGISPSSVHSRYIEDPLTAAFCSNLDDLIKKYQPALWTHGHVHDSFDYKIGKTRVVVNPIGYPGEKTPGPVPILIEL